MNAVSISTDMGLMEMSGEGETDNGTVVATTDAVECDYRHESDGHDWRGRDGYRGGLDRMDKKRAPPSREELRDVTPWERDDLLVPEVVRCGSLLIPRQTIRQLCDSRNFQLQGLAYSDQVRNPKTALDLVETHLHGVKFDPSADNAPAEVFRFLLKLRRTINTQSVPLCHAVTVIQRYVNLDRPCFFDLERLQDTHRSIHSLAYGGQYIPLITVAVWNHQAGQIGQHV